MTELACAWVREHLPEHARRGLDAEDNARLTDHLDLCADCRTEAEVVRMIARPVNVPNGLEQRIIAGLGSRTMPGGRHQLRRYAVAAVFAFAVITGSLLWQVVGGGAQGNVPGAETESVIAWPIGGDPLLHESPGLQALSDEELVTLLQEMES